MSASEAHKRREGSNAFGACTRRGGVHEERRNQRLPPRRCSCLTCIALMPRAWLKVWSTHNEPPFDGLLVLDLVVLLGAMTTPLFGECH